MRYERERGRQRDGMSERVIEVYKMIMMMVGMCRIDVCESCRLVYKTTTVSLEISFTDCKAKICLNVL